MNSKGLTYKELTELQEHIEKYHSWKNSYDNYSNNSSNLTKIIRYVDFKMDTMTCEIWSVIFCDISNSNEREITFRTGMEYNLKDKIYEWLRGEKY